MEKFLEYNRFLRINVGQYSSAAVEYTLPGLDAAATAVIGGNSEGMKAKAVSLRSRNDP